MNLTGQTPKKNRSFRTAVLSSYIFLFLLSPLVYAAYTEYDNPEKLQKDLESSREQLKKTLDAKNMEVQGYLAELRSLDQQMKFVKDETQKDQLKSQRDSIQIKMDDLKKDVKKIQADGATEQRRLNERIERLKLEQIRKKKDESERKKTDAQVKSRNKKEQEEEPKKKSSWRSTGDWSKPTGGASGSWTKTSDGWR